MYIAEITERLLEVNRLLLKYIKDTELTFEENLVFSGFRLQTGDRITVPVPCKVKCQRIHLCHAIRRNLE